MFLHSTVLLTALAASALAAPTEKYSREATPTKYFFVL